MLTASLRARAARVFFVLASGLAVLLPLSAQVALTPGTYTETFDALGAGLPAGWTLHTGASASSAGTAVATAPATASWGDTSGAFKNFAAADSGLTSAATVAQQGAATDRALGLRQTGGFGDPGASFALHFSTLGQQVTAVSFSAQMLSVQARSAVWSVQYGIGTAPESWTTLTTFTDPAAFGATPISLGGFGAALDNQPNAWLRVVALGASTGAGSRDSFAVDDFSITTVSGEGGVPPIITTQPTDQTVIAGTAVQLTVAAAGTEPLSYQWRKGGADLVDAGNISGALTATLTLTPAELGDAGAYDVVVTNAVSSTTSDAATLTVNPPPTPPSITTGPGSQIVNEGAVVQFTVEAAGSGPLSYQWRKDGTDLTNAGIVAGADTATLTLSGVLLGDAGFYDVVVANDVGSVTSAAASLAVNPAPHAPIILTHPVSQSAAVGGAVTFTVEATGTAPLSYQWRKAGVSLADGGIVSGVATAELTLSSVSASDAGDYDVVVSNAIEPAVTSDPATLTVEPLITPAGQVSYVGGTYAQNFDTLPASGTYTFSGSGPFALSGSPIGAEGAGGWTFGKYAGSGANALFRVDAGGGTSGSAYSYGAAGAGDRALGVLSSGSTVPRAGVTLVNHTGQTINEFTLSYRGEQWRRGGSGAANTVTFSYAIGAVDINAGAFVGEAALNFASVNTVPGASSLDGNVEAAAVAATVSGIAWAPGATLVLRWSDVDDSGSDDGLAIDDLSFATPVTPDAVVPAVAFTTPANGAVNVPVDASVGITFSSAVELIGAWFALDGSISGARAATVSGGPTTFTLTPTGAFAEGEVVTLTVFAAGVTDAATGTKHPGGDYATSFITFSSGPLPIHLIQGSGTMSAFANNVAAVEGIVVASFQAPGGIGGYYLEAPDALHDADPATSEGIYVFDNVNGVTVGDRVTLTGTVAEFGSAPNSQTEIKDVTTFVTVSSGNVLPTPVAVTLPIPESGYAERFEGMLVTLPQTLTVTDNYDYGVFGEVILSNGRLSIPTNIAAPGAPAQAQAEANRLNQIVLDDGVSTQYPDPTPYLIGGDAVNRTLRAGSTTTGVTGILDNRFGTYVIEPVFVPTFVDANPRPAAPVVNGRLKVAIGNVLNFFNGDGAGGGFPTSRGASNFAEYQRQRAKIIAGITETAADIIGLTEVENDGFGPLSAIADLVDGLNAAAPAGTSYAFVDGSAVEITTDVIHVAFIYRTETVEEVGAPAMLSHPAFNNLARNPLAQTFREKSTGEVLTVCVNHFRAKGSVASGAGNADAGDGQGNNNALRVQQSNALTAWLATDPTGSGDPDFLIVGDLNAYAKEDPIAAIESAGYVNLTEQFEGVGGYSYSFNGEFGHLDHALANGPLAAQVVDAATWHVNSDEPIYYDYNTENKSADQAAINEGTPYRYADHDPVVVGIDLTSPAEIVTQPVAQATTVGIGVTFSVTATGTPAPTYQWRRDGEPIDGATGATLMIANPVVADSGSYDVVVTNSTGAVTSAAVSLVVSPATATVEIDDLEQRYTGAPRSVTATTTPAGLAVAITYDGSTTPPIYPGVYEVVATIVDPNYVGSASDVLVVTTTALVRHAPAINGEIDGSVQVLLPESVTLNSKSVVTGDLLVPGTPRLVLNGRPTFGGAIEGPGVSTPTSHAVTLNSARLRHLVRRIDAGVMPAVHAPPAPAGTRNVTLNNATQSAGDFATIRNLTLNSNVGTVVVPAGTYGGFVVNGGSALRLGVAGATTPAVYNLQALTLNSKARVEVVGPVIVNVAGAVMLNGSMGENAHPEWLELNVAQGSVTLNSNVTLSGFVVAPQGTVTVNGGAVLQGGVASDRLTLNSNGRVK